MKTPADKSPEPQRQAAAHEAPQQQDRSDAELKFVDNREETASLRKLQEMADNSPRRQGLAQLKAKMDSSPRRDAMQSLQAMVDNSPRRASMRLQTGMGDVPVQRVEDEEVLQGEFAAETPAQLAQPSDEKPNNTGLPDNLKAGVESLSGLSLDNVKVHRNSDKPAQLQAHAYAQGTDIHLGPGQEKHLPHEAWHVVQQKQGRVKPTMQMKDKVNVNDDVGLEKEADVMGDKALKMQTYPSTRASNQASADALIILPKVVMQLNGEKISDTAKEIASGERDVRDEALGLSESQIELIEVMKLQLQLLEQLKRQLDEIERQREAALPPMVRLDSFIEFQPNFDHLESEVENSEMQTGIVAKIASYGSMRVTHLAAKALADRLGTGLKPANQLQGVALSGDDNVAAVVSVNVLPPSGGEHDDRNAEYATSNRAGGAIPIAIEQSGDDGTIDLSILTGRAMNSAVLVIDASKLSASEIKNVQSSSDGGGGETGLASVPSGTIVTVLAPAYLYASLDKSIIQKYNIRFVGAVTSDQYYAGIGRAVRITHPDFRSALVQIFKQNPRKTLITHTTRLGAPKPVKRGTDDAGMSSPLPSFSSSSESERKMKPKPKRVVGLSSKRPASNEDETGSARSQLIKTGIGLFERLLVEWRSNESGREGKYPEQYHDRINTIHSIVHASQDITIDHLRGEIQEWYAAQRQVSELPSN